MQTYGHAFFRTGNTKFIGNNIIKEKLLLHVCCAPCLVGVLPSLNRNGNFDITCFFYNPNIHPYKENRKRLDCLKEYCSKRKIDLEADESYPLEQNLRTLLNADNRCEACFGDRLEQTALYAEDNGYAYFTTTLLISPYQNQILLEKAGRTAEKGRIPEFLFIDFRNSYRESIKLSRELNLYRQSYCGCIMSERDRYLNIRSPGERPRF